MATELVIDLDALIQYGNVTKYITTGTYAGRGGTVPPTCTTQNKSILPRGIANATVRPKAGGGGYEVVLTVGTPYDALTPE
jgi:hypothetical protein